MQENEKLPDMEKLEQLEFNLDVEEQQRLQAKGEQEVTKVTPVYLLSFIYYFNLFLQWKAILNGVTTYFLHWQCSDLMLRIRNCNYHF